MEKLFEQPKQVVLSKRKSACCSFFSQGPVKIEGQCGGAHEIDKEEEEESSQLFSPSPLWGNSFPFRPCAHARGLVLKHRLHSEPVPEGDLLEVQRPVLKSREANLPSQATRHMEHMLELILGNWDICWSWFFLEKKGPVDMVTRATAPKNGVRHYIGKVTHGHSEDGIMDQPPYILYIVAL